MHFYMRNAKLEDIEAFKKSKKLKGLGMPHFVGSGSHELEAQKHRFIVMPRFGRDIWSIFLENGKKFPLHTVYRLALQMLDVLEYIHTCTYVHADLKGANMLLDGVSQTFLVDFGLASHYTTNKEYKPDPKKMHNGTIEYTSRDAHNGVLTMRGDMEILAYNLIHWIGINLSWEKCLTDPVKVHQLKEKLMKNLADIPKEVPQPIVNFFKIVAQMKFDERPNYDKCKKLFIDGIKSLGQKDSGPLEFSTIASLKGKTNSKNGIAAEPTDKNDKPHRSTRNSPKNKSAAEPGGSKASGSIVLETPTKGKCKKTYQFNINLDVSIDADVVVNVHRKNKKDGEKKSSPKTKAAEPPITVQDSSEDEYVPSSQPEVVRMPRKRKTAVKEDEGAKTNAKISKRAQLNIPQISARAGEYKGRKAKE